MSPTELMQTTNLSIPLNKSTPVKAKERPVVYITAKAGYKMRALIQSCGIEVAWHMLIQREDNTFRILDILVYPQKASGAYVESDDDRYMEWLVALTDEEHAMLHGQGHSHVNMGTFPSGVDMDHRDRLLRHVPKDGFYIFLITNKQGNQSFTIYDKAKSCIYEPTDVNVVQAEVAWAEKQLKQFLKKIGGKQSGPEKESGLLRPEQLEIDSPSDWTGCDRIYGSY